MTKLITLICVGLIAHSITVAQSQEIDSLFQLLEGYKPTDSLKAQYYLNLALKLRRVNPNQAKFYYDSAAMVAERVREPELQVKANNGLAICFGILGNYPEAIQAFHRTIELSKKYNLPGRTADGYNGLGIVYKRLGDYPQSLEYYSKAIPIYDSVSDYRGLGAAYENIGVLYDLMHEPDKSMESYQKAISIYTQQNEKLLVSLAQDNIAVLLIDKQKYDEALAIFERNIAIYDSLHRTPSAIASKINIAYIYIKQKKYKQAKELLLGLLVTAREFSLKQEETNIINNLFEIALSENDLESAQRYATTYQALANTLDSKDYKKTSYLLLSKLYEKTKDFAKSLEAYKQYKAWSDSLINEENARVFNAQEVKIEVLEKNKQLAEQNLRLNFLQNEVVQQNRIKWLLIVAAMLLLATLVLLYQKFAIRKRVNEMLTAKNEEISRQKLHIEEINYQLENRMLRAQINPHFIFNSLSSIQHFITSDQKPAALKYLAKFSNLLRKVLESSITGNVLVEEEIELLSMYLELEALRFNGDFTYAITVDDSLDVNAHEIPTMLLQPIIENAILHGLLPKEQNKKLNIAFKHVDSTIEIDVIDNGIGRDASRALQATKRKATPSRGISVTEQRIQSLKENYGWHISMTYHDLKDENGNPTGTRVQLTIPLLDTI